jgi:hypothetical protein
MGIDEVNLFWIRDMLQQQKNMLDTQQGEIEALTILCGRLLAKDPHWEDLMGILKDFSNFASRRTNLAAYLDGMASTVECLCNSVEAIGATRSTPKK